MTTSIKDVPAKKAEETAAQEEQHAGQQDAAGKRPIWSRTLNRVDGSIWKHDQKGEARYTVAISRSYLEKKTNQWKRSFYFDKNDLQDVRSICNEAEDQILDLEGMTAAPGED